MNFVKGMVSQFSGESNPHYVIDMISFRTYIHTIIPHVAEFDAQNIGSYHKRNLLKHIENSEGRNPKVLDTSTHELMIQNLANVIEHRT